MASRSEAKSKDPKKFIIQLIHRILRHFVPKNDSALFVGRDFVYTLKRPGESRGAFPVAAKIQNGFKRFAPNKPEFYLQI